MGNHQNQIELNGKKYDALTGKIIDKATIIKPKPLPNTTKSVMGANIDGFKRTHKASITQHTPATTVHSSAQHSKTLMRFAVKKPVVLKQDNKHTPQSFTASNNHAVSVHENISNPHFDPKRASRAELVNKSEAISRFGNKETDIPAIIAVKPHPPLTHSIQNTEKKQPHTTEDPFQKAMDAAQGHTFKPLKQKKHHVVASKLRIHPKLLNIGAACLAFIVIGGFFAYQNMPNLAVHLAAQRAGVNAKMPGYQPAGYSVNGPIQAKPGQIVISFHSNATDSRGFSITQSTSSWNSEALLENFVATNNKQYQTYQDNGKTIYIYDGGNATWVDAGVWYKVEGTNALNSDQLLRIANSI
ncbi:MAG: hypothetical protein NVSMB46_07910 [Candidatus Saccharimonadales bacterium]